MVFLILRWTSLFIHTNSYHSPHFQAVEKIEFCLEFWELIELFTTWPAGPKMKESGHGVDYSKVDLNILYWDEDLLFGEYMIVPIIG